MCTEVKIRLCCHVLIMLGAMFAATALALAHSIDGNEALLVVVAAAGIGGTGSSLVGVLGGNGNGAAKGP